MNLTFPDAGAKPRTWVSTLNQAIKDVAGAVLTVSGSLQTLAHGLVFSGPVDVAVDVTGSGTGVDVDVTGTGSVLVSGSSSGYGVDVAGNATKAPIHILPQTQPSSPGEGDVYYSSVYNRPFHYNGSTWLPLPPPPTASALAYYTFDGVATDSVGTGPTLSLSHINYVSGILGQAIAGDGDVAATAFSADNTLNLTGDFTISCWFWWGVTDYQFLSVRTDDHAVDVNHEFRINPSGIFEFVAGAGGVLAGTNSVSSITRDTWVMATITRTGTAIKFYINGTDSGGGGVVAVGASLPSPVSTYVGLREDFVPAWKFQSKIDELGYWSRALTATEIQTLYWAGAPKHYPFL